MTITLESGRKVRTTTNRAYILVSEHPGEKPFIAKRSHEPSVLTKEASRLRNQGSSARFTLASTVTGETWPV